MKIMKKTGCKKDRLINVGKLMVPVTGPPFFYNFRSRSQRQSSGTDLNYQLPDDLLVNLAEIVDIG